MVIGASGKTGRHVVAGLVSRGATVRAASRTPEQLDAPGADPTRFDWHDESTWGPALETVDGVYLVKPESSDVVEVVGRFLGAMKAVGAARLVFLSESATQTRSDDITERHVERVVEASGLQWTILRPSWYMDDIVDAEFFGSMVRDDRIIVMTTGGSATAWIDARDIADVAAEILVNGGEVGRALDLTGPEALTLDQLAERITAAAGDPVKGVEESVLEAKSRMRAEGLDEGFVAYMTRIVESIVAGDTATVTGEVERVTGRPPRNIDAFLAEHAAQLRPVREVKSELDAEYANQLARENEALFRRQISAWARNDLDDLIDCYTDDMVYTDMPFADQQVRGKAAFREYMAGYNALFAGSQVEVEIVTLVASSANVVGELLCRARYVGTGAPEGGVPVEWYATLVDTIVGRKIVSEHAYFDPTAFDKAVEQTAT
ncbi:NAD(P)H-binding protein [Amycolatopsis nivea]|uniref:NAD(P)H-binding protein n=1 Tax=Amycolatopsis nivea TaxID=1644109 RepID=UPI00131A3E62|nr:NAD(P)H-binding protein [Amycolatopsis nivea]